ncbi:post-GPI attachment to proteins factor 6 [Pectinophora gossypiella]|uniref:post-GPI attachment to proteins factor 6 n=1 Tax=Pectinophora gossypiella TaxID=13191 RepID=UPI00214EAE66|nr:post-GPI attachment to proteins factor 6 [Pectinophora gossypiella]
MRVYFLLLCVYSVASVSDKESELESKRRTVLEQLTKTRTVLLDGYHLVTRQIATDVHMFRSYRTVSVIFYPIMRDVTDARFTFQSEELHLNNIGSCEPQDVVINIKRASYPAVNPDGYDFPKDFLDPASRDKIHTIEIYSDGKNRTHSIKNPRPGNWYALVYIKWEDPRTQKVEQQGLVADCNTILYTDLQVKREDEIELIDCYSGLTIDSADIPANFKCMSLDNASPISFNITVTNTSNSSNILFRVQALSLPTEEEYLITCAFDPKLNNIQTITFIPNPISWHYIQVEPIQNTSKYADCESYYYRTDIEETDNHTVLDLMRDDKGRFFTFEYGLPTTDVQDATSLINITSNEIKSVRFKVNQFIDIGGNLAIEASLLMSLKYYMGYRREMKKGALLGFTQENQFYRAVICLDIGHTSIPLETGHCKYNDKVKPALFVLNSTDSESIYEKTIIPYPDSGTWYLTSRLFCDEVVCPCRTSHNGTKYYVDAEAADKEGENLSGEFTNYTREGETNCNATLVLSISSTSCLNGRCSNHGNCLLNTFGGLVMSFCSCSAGYGGWDCSDDSRMDSRMYMLIAVLLLTLSNLLFFISIYVAIIRLYYTEAMMYAFTMVFSTFYHACDAPAQVAYCITRGNILQFGDFYCGIMSFWVTLLAMSVIGDKLRSSFQLIGAIVIALLTTWNMHSFVAFMLPVAVGVFVLLLSWFLDYRKTRSMSYHRSYYTRHLPFGIALVSVGLICYAFLQTEQNYKIIHSIWHAIIALSVVFLLPDVKREGSPNPFLPSSNYCKLPFRRIFSRSPAPATPGNQS